MGNSNPFDDIHPSLLGYDADADDIIREAREQGSAPAPVDDWTQQLADMGTARAAHPSDDVHAAIAERGLQQQQLTSQAMPVRTAPPSAGAAVMGAQVVLTSGQESQGVVYWTGEDVDSQPVTVDLTRVGATGGLTWPQATDAGGSNPFSYRATATIRWGTRATSSQVKVDIGRGTQVCVTGASVYVTLSMAPAPTDPAYVAGTMALAAQLSFGARQSATPCVKSEYADAIAPTGGTSKIVIPDYAVTLRSVMRFPTSCAIDIEVDDTNNRRLELISLAANTLLAYPIDLPTDAYKIGITNQDATNKANVILVFGLAV